MKQHVLLALLFLLLNTPVALFSQCNVEGGALFGGPFQFCTGDGIPDMIDDADYTLNGAVGELSQWIVTDNNGNILGLPPTPSVVNFDGAGAGICVLYHVSYQTGLSGLEVNLNINNLIGCFDLSTAISIVRSDSGSVCDNVCAVTAAEIIFSDDATNTSICVDGFADPLFVEFTAQGSGTNSAWVITDESLTILGLTPAPPFDLDGAGPGTCLIWYLTFEDGLTGAEVDLNAVDLDGCFELSNPLTVTRNAPFIEGCQN